VKKIVAAIGAGVIVTVAILLLAGGGSHKQAAVIPQSAMGSVHPVGWGQTPPGFVLPPQHLTAVPTATMWDAITLSNVPAKPFAIAGYIAGNWPTWFQLAADFPAAHRVSIAIHLGEHAMCGDFEPGDMAPSQAGEWAKQDLAAGFKTPCEYGDLANMPAIKQSLAAALGARWRSLSLLWLAWYRGIPALISGYDAVQFTDNALGRNLDENTVTLNFLRIAQPPYVPPPTNPICFTHRIPAAACAQVKAKIASDKRAAASSQRALVATNRVLATNKCRKPYRRGVCIHKGHDASVFAQRVAYFTNAAKQLQEKN